MLIAGNATFGVANWNTTEQYLEEDGGPPNLALAQEIFPYARTAMILFSCGRVILFLMSLKYPQVSKSFIYYELLNLVIDSLLPTDTKFNVRMLTLVLTNIISFMTNYFHALPSVIVLCI